MNMKTPAPKTFGIWTLEERESNNAMTAREEPAKINGKPVYCPLCKKRMKMWMEGCTLWHINCKACRLCLTVKTEDGKVFEKLLRAIYE